MSYRKPVLYVITKQNIIYINFEFWKMDITNSIPPLGKPSKNEIQQPNYYKKVFGCVWKNLKIINNLMLRQAWTGGRPVSSICTDRTDFEMLKAYRTNVLKVI